MKCGYVCVWVFLCVDVCNVWVCVVVGFCSVSV